MSPVSLKLLFLFTYSSVILFDGVSCFAQTRKFISMSDDFHRSYRLEAKDIDDTTAERFFLLYNIGQKKIKESRTAFDEAINELDKVKASGNNLQIKQLTEQMLQKHKGFQDANNEMLKSIRGVLTEKQYAEFLVFEAKFPEILRKSIQERKDSLRK
jgi:hypothetical protein